MENNVRKALADIVRILKGFDFDNPQIPDNLNCVSGAIETAEAALAAPLCNSEVGTAEEQAQRYDEFCAKTNCAKCPVKALWKHYFGVVKNENVSCGLIWSQMPYEADTEKKGEGDGK